MYQSKDIDLDADPKGWGPMWTKKDLVWVVQNLESLSRKKLVELCKLPEINLRFNAKDWEESTPDDQIIAVLLIDYTPKELIRALKSML